MPIVRKSKSQQHFKRLQARVEVLSKVMQGVEPNRGLWNFYALNEEDYIRDFVEVDQAELSLALDDLTSAVKALKKTKTLQADKLHTP